MLDLVAGGPQKLLDAFWHIKISKGLGGNHFRLGSVVHTHTHTHIKNHYPTGITFARGPDTLKAPPVTTGT